MIRPLARLVETSALPRRAGWLGASVVLLVWSAAFAAVGQDREGDSLVPVWRNGRIADTTPIRDASARGLLVLDLGAAWVPYVMSGTERMPHAYEPVYRALAQGEFPNTLEGHRAELDRYHELYGIPPTLGVLRERFYEIANSSCRGRIDLATLREFEGTALTEKEENPPVAEAGNLLVGLVSQVMERQGALLDGELDRSVLAPMDRRVVDFHARAAHWQRVLAAIRYRLACEGHLRGRMPTDPDLDRRTRLAIAELERAHRIYARGNLSGETLRALQTDPLELARQGIVRVLVERAVLSAGIIEDGSTSVGDDGAPRTFRTSQGQEEPMRDLVDELRTKLVDAFGLHTPEQTGEWLWRLGGLPPDGHVYVAIDAVDLPEYYGDDMDLFVQIDRGDVWYDFPFDEHGRPLPQPVERYPTLTLFVRYRGQAIPLVRHGTTVGSWRLARSRDREVWVYKESPVGPRVWAHVVSAPVWLPPADTPASSLVTQIRRTEEGELITEVNRNLVGPGYASAYGLIAGYHRRYTERRDGSHLLGADEGIRTHGSVDYTSIWQRASHGCHRLRNHLAMRLFTFVLKHREHRRQGHRAVDYRRTVEVEGLRDEVRIERTGYFFALRRPLEVEVLPGRILGRAREPLREAIPRLSGDREDG